jgi:hypothetical protein
MFEIGSATDYRDLLAKLNTFLTTNGSAFGLTYAGTGNGTITGYKGGTASVAEYFYITATSATNFTVWGSVSGSLAAATVGTPYTGTKIQFLLTQGGTQFVSGDRFVLNTAPKWTARRALPGAVMSATAGSSGQYSMENVNDGKLVSDSSRYWDAYAVRPAALQFDFPAGVTIAQYAIMCGYTSGYAPTAWTFDYWTGSAWSPLDTQSSITTWGAQEIKTFTVGSPVSATRYRLNFTAGNSASYLQVGLVHLRVAAGGIDYAMSQYIWEAPGNDGLSAILVGAKAFQHIGADYFDWQLYAFDGFDAVQHMHTQPGVRRGPFLPLWNTTIPYWFINDGRRVMVIAKLGSAQYESAYMGFLEPFFTPTQMPYPIALGGSLTVVGTNYWNNVIFRYSNSTDQHRAFPLSDPGIGYAGPTTYLYAYQMQARRLDGSWAGFLATYGDSAPYDPQTTGAVIWPYAMGLSNLDTNVDGSYAMFPVWLADAGPNNPGQLAGVGALTGQGISGEALVHIGAVDWLVLPNISRVDKNDFYAVRLD